MYVYGQGYLLNRRSPQMLDMRNRHLSKWGSHIWGDVHLLSDDVRGTHFSRPREDRLLPGESCMVRLAVQNHDAYMLTTSNV